MTADLLLLTFCKKFKQLYGGENCTPNLHLHLHLKDCLLDYGPSYAFWCFSFERYNGLLGSFNTNRSIEQQIMRNFVNAKHLHSEAKLADVQLLSLLTDSEQPAKPALTAASVRDTDILQILRLSSSPLPSIQSFENHGIATLLPPLQEDVFDSTINRQRFRIALHSAAASVRDTDILQILRLSSCFTLLCSIWTCYFV